MKNAMRFIEAIRDVLAELPETEENLSKIYQELSEFPLRILVDNAHFKNKQGSSLDFLLDEFEQLTDRLYYYISGHKNQPLYPLTSNDPWRHNNIKPYEIYKAQISYVLILCLYYKNKKALFGSSSRAKAKSDRADRKSLLEDTSIEFEIEHTRFHKQEEIYKKQSEDLIAEKCRKQLNDDAFQSTCSTKKGEALYYLALMRENGIPSSWSISNLRVRINDQNPELVKDNQVLNCFLFALDHNHYKSLYKVGQYHEQGLGGFPCNFEEAVRLYQLACEKADDSRAHLRLAIFYSTGYKSVPMNCRLSVSHYEKAAKKGQLVAVSQLAQSYEMGKDGVLKCHHKKEKYSEAVKKVYGKSILQVDHSAILDLERVKGEVNQLLDLEISQKKLFDKTAWFDIILSLKKLKDLNIVAAISMLGKVYEYGVKDLTAALDYYQQAAAQGCPFSQNKMGVYFQNTLSGEMGNSEEQSKLENDKIAYRYFCAAALNFGSEALNNLGLCYERGIGTKIDLVEAQKCYRKAIAQGNKDANFRLAELVDNNLDKGLFTGEDLKEALSVYIQFLGLSYYGSCLTKESLEAVAKDPSKQPLREKTIRLALIIGSLYERGAQGFPKCIVLALDRYYRIAADLGSTETWIKMGLLEEQIGRLYLVFYWYKNALPLTEAQLNVARCTEFGIGTKQNVNEAFVQFEKLAEQGIPKAIHALGRFYEEGKGREQDPAMALFYYRKAANLGCKDASTLLMRFEQVSDFFNTYEHNIIGKHLSALITEYASGAEDLSLIREKELKEKEELAKLEKGKRKGKPTKRERPKKDAKKRDKCLVM